MERSVMHFLRAVLLQNVTLSVKLCLSQALFEPAAHAVALYDAAPSVCLQPCSAT